MGLTKREKLLVAISNGISAFSLLRESKDLPADATMHGFVLRAVPEDLKADLTAELIDEVFECVASAHSS